MSLRPIIPAAPITTIFNGVPSLFLDPAIVGAERTVPAILRRNVRLPASLRESLSPLHVTRYGPDNRGEIMARRFFDALTEQALN
jgi:hypothetical protein